MGREEAKEQSKAAQREKEQAAYAKKQAARDKQVRATHVVRAKGQARAMGRTCACAPARRHFWADSLAARLARRGAGVRGSRCVCVWVCVLAGMGACRSACMLVCVHLDVRGR
eukprot:23031-Pleurochrysis_carterae.AAC.5